MIGLSNGEHGGNILACNFLDCSVEWQSIRRTPSDARSPLRCLPWILVQSTFMVGQFVGRRLNIRLGPRACQVECLP